VVDENSDEDETPSKESKSTDSKTTSGKVDLKEKYEMEKKRVEDEIYSKLSTEERGMIEKYDIIDGRHIRNPYVGKEIDTNVEYDELNIEIFKQIMELMNTFIKKCPPELKE
jgi:hypothetical protein